MAAVSTQSSCSYPVLCAVSQLLSLNRLVLGLLLQVLPTFPRLDCSHIQVSFKSLHVLSHFSVWIQLSSLPAQHMPLSQVSTQLPTLQTLFHIYCLSSLLQISIFLLYNHHPSCLSNSNTECSFSFNVLLPQLCFLMRIFGESKLFLEVASLWISWTRETDTLEALVQYCYFILFFASKSHPSLPSFYKTTECGSLFRKDVHFIS